MAIKTFTALTNEGVLKRGNRYQAKLSDLHVEDGFNLRTEGDDLDAHIDSLYQSIMSGVSVPPIEVRIGDDDKMYIVDGHCRRRAFLKAIQSGAEIEYVDIQPFQGNDADRVVKVIASSQGKALSPIEYSLGFKRLRAFGWDVDKIAKSVGKTRSYVDQLLILADANSDVHKLVQDGSVAAHLAIDVVRNKGEKAGEFLNTQLNTAKELGKDKITKSTLKKNNAEIVKNTSKSGEQLEQLTDADIKAIISRYERLKSSVLESLGKILQSSGNKEEVEGLANELLISLDK